MYFRLGQYVHQRCGCRSNSASYVSVSLFRSRTIVVDDTGLSNMSSYRYLYQLLVGCENDDCREVLCHTGRANRSQIAIRRYTARSAKAIALTVCSEPSPRRHLCQYCPQQVEYALDSRPTAKRDESSLLQQLCDSKGLESMGTEYSSKTTQLRQLHYQIDSLIEANDPRDYSKSVASNRELVNALLPMLDFLVASLPPHRPAVLEMIDREIISQGNCYPQKIESPPNDNKFNVWLALLDALDYEPHSRLLQRTLMLIASRLKLEHQIRELKKKASADSSDSRAGQSITAWLAFRLYERSCGKLSELYALAVFMKKHFAKTWSPETPLEPGTIAHAILDTFSFFEAYRQALPESFPRDAFKLPVVNERTTPVDLATSWVSSINSYHHVLEYRFVFSLEQLFLCFRTINHLSMRYVFCTSIPYAVTILTFEIERRIRNLPKHSLYASKNLAASSRSTCRLKSNIPRTIICC